MAGAQRIMLRLEDADTTIDLAVKARPLAPANLEFEGAPPSGATARPLPKPLTVVVTDAYGNPVADRAVRFATRAGKVAPERVMTDAQGRARTRWTLGAKPGEQLLEASVTGMALRDTAVVTVRKPAAKG